MKAVRLASMNYVIWCHFLNCSFIKWYGSSLGMLLLLIMMKRCYCWGFCCWEGREAFCYCCHLLLASSCFCMMPLQNCWMLSSDAIADDGDDDEKETKWQKKRRITKKKKTLCIHIIWNIREDGRVFISWGNAANFFPGGTALQRSITHISAFATSARPPLICLPSQLQLALLS